MILYNIATRYTCKLNVEQVGGEFPSVAHREVLVRPITLRVVNSDAGLHIRLMNFIKMLSIPIIHEGPDAKIATI